jgi:hypothetical protein
MSIKNLFTLFLGFAFLCGCISSGVKTSPTLEATPTVEQFPTIQPTAQLDPANEMIGGFDVKRALESMYKGWTITTTDSGKIAAQQEDISKDITKTEVVTLVAPFRQQQEDRVLVVTRYSDSQEIRAVRSIEGTVFVGQKKSWILEHTGMLASYSGSATSELVQMGVEHYGVLVRTQYAGTGRGVEGAILNVYTSDGWQKVWEEQIGEAEFEKWNYSSEIVFLADEKGGYYNMQVTATGTDASLKKFEETRLYSFDEGVYKLVSTVRHGSP